MRVFGSVGARAADSSYLLSTWFFSSLVLISIFLVNIFNCLSVCTSSHSLVSWFIFKLHLNPLFSKKRYILKQFIYLFIYDSGTFNDRFEIHFVRGFHSPVKTYDITIRRVIKIFDCLYEIKTPYDTSMKFWTFHKHHILRLCKKN